MMVTEQISTHISGRRHPPWVLATSEEGSRSPIGSPSSQIDQGFPVGDLDRFAGWGYQSTTPARESIGNSDSESSVNLGVRAADSPPRSSVPTEDVGNFGGGVGVAD
ncbi:hypothetical protein CRG98_015036 [Punica granatum]|uniref:Uncharacterized protein n=1 Tax=Punica granatum TaxID=22663 RepID=A0A2I0K7T1_PUNGR|nr:hypothetical protein CRG98_015036 [Punica granatum]